MESQRKFKVFAMITLVIAVVGMSLGFAAFSATLSISSSASVTPNSDSFKVVFSTSSSSIDTSSSSCKTITGVGVNGTDSIVGSIGCVKPTSISDVVVNFTEPGQTIKYTFYVHNDGAYDVYFQKFRAGLLDNGSYKKCIASSGTTDSLVQQACDGISILADIDGNLSTLGKNFIDTIISPGDVQTIDFYIMYNYDAVRADGAFTVEFADVFLDYGTNNGEDIISFIIDETVYYGEVGMTWGDWLNSQYSMGNFNTYQGYYIEAPGGYAVKDINGKLVTVDDVIVSGGEYILY